MDTLIHMQQGFINALQWQALLMMVLGTLIGTFAGIIPGLSSGHVGGAVSAAYIHHERRCTGSSF